ncbi:hypothetical protein BDV24DRAFT_163813 [Aspergillus arachidicola]|uniref:Uncharacterized protein n=1 Tax=Aspergillus arachidicola TaxID=656916 RepID=A0A5N6Y6S5_9EURO|nr:hypothetical protein BDV24DRAFT_163813 [Aspergillus arachidicola]
MPGFLSLPPELIFQVYCSLDTIGDAYFLSQTCQQTYSIFRRPQSRPKIFEAIIDHIIHDAAPTKAWLEEQFGPGSLWQPTEAELPVDLTNEETIKFLLNVGFPAVNLPRMGFNSSDLRISAHKGQTLDGYTADELFDIFNHEDTDEDEGKPPALSVRFGAIHHKLVLLNNKNGIIYFYDPENWFSHRGVIANGLDKLSVLLGMVVAVTKDLRTASLGISWNHRFEILIGPLDALLRKLRDYDFPAGYGSEFWCGLIWNLLAFPEMDT